MIIRHGDYKIAVVHVHRQQEQATYVAALFDGYLPCVIVSRTNEQEAVRECVRLFEQSYQPAQKRMREYLRKVNGKFSEKGKDSGIS